MRSAFIEIRSIKNLHDAEPLKKRIVQKKHREKSNCAGAKRRKDEQKTETKDTENRGKNQRMDFDGHGNHGGISGIVRSRDHRDARMGTGLVSGADLHGCDRRGWLIMFMAANGAFDEMDLYDDEDEEDEPWEE